MYGLWTPPPANAAFFVQDTTLLSRACVGIFRPLHACSLWSPQAVMPPHTSSRFAGIGFAKTCAGSCALVAGLPRVRAQLRGALRNAPLLVGPSRKKFLGRLTGAQRPQWPPGFAHAPTLFRRSDMSCSVERSWT
jgi:hypothetical protein